MIYKNIKGGTRINLTIANEHVPYIERRTRLVKERTRAVRNILNFNKIPKFLTIYIVSTVFKMLNYFPVKGGVSIIEKIHYKRHLELKIGQYFQVHEHEYPKNSQGTRAKGAICIGPIIDEQG